MSGQAAQRARARWLCRRGMKELDVLLTRFMDAHYDAMTAQERARFQSVLELPDPDLWACLVSGSSTGDPSLDHVIARIRDRH